MKAYFLISLLLLTFVACDQLGDKRYPASELDIHIWPQPKSIKTGDSTIYVNKERFAFKPENDNVDIRDAIIRYSQLIFPRASPVQKNAVYLPGIQIKVDNYDAELQIGHDESYTLTIPDNGGDAILHAGTVYGIYHGLETLNQIIVYNFTEEVYMIKKAPYTIEDAPKYSHRGLLMDTSRHYLSVKSIRKIIDSLTYAKINTLHWHITDTDSAPIQSKTYPHFWDGAYTEFEKYTQTDVAEIVEYARKRGVRVMPEFDVPGHSQSWCKGVPDICPAPDCLNPLDLTKDETYTFLTSLFNEMSGSKHGGGLFPDNFFHLGGDEVDTSCWSKITRIADWLKAKGMSNIDGYHYIIDKTAKIVLSQNRNPVHWEEVWNAFGTKLDNRTIIHVWLDKNTLKKVVEQGYKAILSNYQNWYLDFLDHDWKKFYTNIPSAGISEEFQKNIIGGETCMWAETVDISVWFSTVWPRAGAAAEVLWSPDNALNDLESAKLRLMWFRCYLNRRNINAGPVDRNGRQHPDHQDSCFIQ